MRKTDRELGMLRQITRRDFMSQATSLAALGLMLPAGLRAQLQGPKRTSLKHRVPSNTNRNTRLAARLLRNSTCTGP